MVISATKQAEAFVEVSTYFEAAHSARSFSLRASQAFYSGQDAALPERVTRVQGLYSPAARITWNGNPIPYGELPGFLERMPKSLHEVQAFDCHPITGEQLFCFQLCWQSASS